MHHPGQRRGSRLGSPGAKQERAKRIVTSLAGFPQAPTVTGEGHFTGGQSQERCAQREGGPIIE